MSSAAPSSSSVAAGSADPSTARRISKHSKFTQQELPACKPILTPRRVISAFMLVSVIFIPIGVASLFASRNMASKLFSRTTSLGFRFFLQSQLLKGPVAGATVNYTTQSVSTNEPVVSVDWLQANLKEPNLKVMDASWYMPDEQRNTLQEYKVAHIPGAFFFDVDGISDRTTKLPHMLPSEEAFAAAASSLGIENKDRLVIYDGKGIFSAARVWWMFRVFGHERVWVLDGGLPRWRASGYDVESSASNDAILKASAATEATEKVYHGQMVGPITFKTIFQPNLVWSLEQVRRNIEEKTHQHIDARSKARFDGTAPEPRKGIRSGHVPGSKCIPFGQMLDGSQALLPSDDLKKRFEQEGLCLDKPVVASCGTGVTACILALGLHGVGAKDVAVYDGSWTEWGANPDTPIDTTVATTTSN